MDPAHLDLRGKQVSTASHAIDATMIPFFAADRWRREVLCQAL